MTDKLKDFLKTADTNEAIRNKLDVLKEETDQEKVIKDTIKIAAEAGITLTEIDFKGANEELDDKELEAISGGEGKGCWTNGGSERCFCFVGGGGTANEYDQTCACVSYGGGSSKSGRLACACYMAGSGD